MKGAVIPFGGPFVWRQAFVDISRGRKLHHLVDMFIDSRTPGAREEDIKLD